MSPPVLEGLAEPGGFVFQEALTSRFTLDNHEIPEMLIINFDSLFHITNGNQSVIGNK